MIRRLAENNPPFLYQGKCRDFLSERLLNGFTMIRYSL